MILAATSTVSDAAATLFGIIITLLVAIFAGVWRLGNKIGGLDSTIISHGHRITRLEDNADDHDDWHLRRGDT